MCYSISSFFSFMSCYFQWKGKQLNFRIIWPHSFGIFGFVSILVFLFVFGTCTPSIITCIVFPCISINPCVAEQTQVKTLFLWFWQQDDQNHHEKSWILLDILRVSSTNFSAILHLHLVNMLKDHCGQSVFP